MHMTNRTTRNCLPLLLVFLLLGSGCSQAFRQRLSYSKTTVAKLRDSATNAYWQEMYSRMAGGLDAYESQPSKRPRLLTAGVLKTEGSCLLSVYWAAEAHSVVHGIVITGGEKDTMLTLDVPDEYQAVNRRDMEKGVIAYAVFKWSKHDVPPAILDTDAKVGLRGRGLAKGQNGVDILMASTTDGEK